MDQVVMPKDNLERLIKHLVHIEEQKERILSEYYSAITAERRSVEVFIDEYIKNVEAYISDCQARGAECSSLVIIGSTVEIEDIQYQEIDHYQIINPFESNIRGKTNTASFLSPMGRALLLRKPNEKVIVETPAGKFQYKILSVEMFENKCN
jgi:transcription elongation factor GreA